MRHSQPSVPNASIRISEPVSSRIAGPGRRQLGHFTLSHEGLWMTMPP